MGLIGLHKPLSPLLSLCFQGLYRSLKLLQVLHNLARGWVASSYQFLPRTEHCFGQSIPAVYLILQVLERVKSKIIDQKLKLWNFYSRKCSQVIPL